MAGYKFYTGDIVEVLSYIPEKWSEIKPSDRVGMRYRLKVGPDSCSYKHPTANELVTYKNDYKYELEGGGHTTPERIMLYKRPLKNWIKFFLNK